VVTGNLVNEPDWKALYNNLTENDRDQFCKELPGFPLCRQGLRGSVFSGNMQLMSKAQNYGCWCDILNGLIKKSHGKAVNALDEACKQLHHNYNCINIENDCNPRTLDSSKSDYEVPILIFVPSFDIKSLCAAANENNGCGEDTCIAEGTFLRDTFAPLFRGDSEWTSMWNDENYQHVESGGLFDYELECEGLDFRSFSYEDSYGDDAYDTSNTSSFVATNGNGHEYSPQQQKECCGVYPNKQEYWTNLKMCCDGKIESPGYC